jgi:hypothetical protein
MARPITDTLRLLHGGVFIEECSDLLSQVVRSVDDTGKSGKLTITLDVKKVGAAVSVLAKVTDKTPEKAPDPDLFYATVEGNLTVDNPNQRKLDLRMADSPAPSVRNLEPEPAPIKQAS